MKCEKLIPTRSWGFYLATEKAQDASIVSDFNEYQMENKINSV